MLLFLVSLPLRSILGLGYARRAPAVQKCLLSLQARCPIPALSRAQNANLCSLILSFFPNGLVNIWPYSASLLEMLPGGWWPFKFENSNSAAVEKKATPSILKKKNVVDTVSKGILTFCFYKKLSKCSICIFL